ncbi:stage III sporulation protein AD [Salimicrobium halophilum]|uniref:Stage III sporulation protein AD n=1 Tax=Salimicrobium halophilum TaxID=86666 RepID=A0A1G8PUY7_9BACI|nr:stage III sporulation protein AD [Salimicrobium halophilum]SDI96076.1 stage III sporulation protein AD [Salimicrobium halophilum]
MDIFQTASFAFIAACLVLLLKEQHPTLAFLLLFVSVLLIFFVILDQVRHIFRLLYTMAEYANINQSYIETIIKIIGIAYVTEFSSQLIKDAGLDSLALKVEMAGKVFILLVAIPILTTIVEMTLQLLPN